MQINFIGEISDKIVRQCYLYLQEKYIREHGNKPIQSESIDKQEIHDKVEPDLGRNDAWNTQN
jgi:hypothetical protein